MIVPPEYDSLQAYFDAINKLDELHKSTDGIMLVRGDGWDGSAILVFYDKDSFTLADRPDRFEDFQVAWIDTHKELDLHTAALARLVKEFPDVDQSCDPFSYFKDKITFFEKIITDFNSRKNK